MERGHPKCCIFRLVLCIFEGGENKRNNNGTLLCNPDKTNTFHTEHLTLHDVGAVWRDLLNIAQSQFNPDTANLRGEQRLHKVHFPTFPFSKAAASWDKS